MDIEAENTRSTFRGRTVLVTGATSGIGSATAQALHAAGFLVFGGVRTSAAATELSRRGITPVLLDLCQPDSIERAAAMFRASSAPLYGLVNNAGIACAGPWESLDENELRRVFEVNFFGLVHLTRALLPVIRNAQGRIVMMSSIAGSVASPFIGAYCCSKFALEAFADSLRREIAGQGISVTSIKPAAVETPMWNKLSATFETPPMTSDDMYSSRLTTSRQRIASTTDKRLSPVRVAAAVEHTLMSKKCPPKSIVIARGGRFRLWLQGCIPADVVDWLIQRA